MYSSSEDLDHNLNPDVPYHVLMMTRTIFRVKFQKMVSTSQATVLFILKRNSSDHSPFTRFFYTGALWLRPEGLGASAIETRLLWSVGMKARKGEGV